MKKINLSFKETEMYIYNHIKKQMNFSVYIKQLVLKDIKEIGVDEDEPFRKITRAEENMIGDENNIVF